VLMSDNDYEEEDGDGEERQDDPGRLPTPQLVAMEGEDTIKPIGEYDEQTTEDLDYALDIMLNQQNGDQSDDTPLATPSLRQTPLPVTNDDFGFEQLDSGTPQKLKESSYAVEVEGHVNASMHGASPPPKMPRGMRYDSGRKSVQQFGIIPSPGRWQNGAAVLIQAWYRGNIYRIRNYALLVACRRLYERTQWRSQLERMHEGDVATHQREMNAIEMVLSMEQRKSSRLEGLMGEAARKYEQEMTALQQKQRWGSNRTSSDVRLNSDGRIIPTSSLVSGTGGAIPFTVQAQHKARKDAETKLKTASAKIIHLKNTIKILLAKLKRNAADERKKATKQVGKIRQEMIWHEKRSMSEISRLTGIVDSMALDPDIVKITTGPVKSPMKNSDAQTDASAVVVPSVRRRKPAMSPGGSFIVGDSTQTSTSSRDLGGHRSVDAWGDERGGGTHSPTSLSHLGRGKQHRSPNKKWSGGGGGSIGGGISGSINEEGEYSEYDVNLRMQDHFTQRVMIKARSEVALSEAGFAAADGVDDESMTLDRGTSLPTIDGVAGRRGGRSPGGMSNASSHRRGIGSGYGQQRGRDKTKATRNNAMRSSRLGYNKSSMLKRLELVGNIAAEEVSPEKMSRRKRVRGSREVMDAMLAPTLGAMEVAASTEVEASVAEQHLQQQIQQQQTYRQLAQNRRKGGAGGGARKQDLRKLYGV
jgi:hypothetical protein